MTSLPYHHSPNTPKENDTDHGLFAQCLHVLELKGDEHLEEVDAKYFELISIWSGPRPSSDDSLRIAQNQIRVIDAAYQAILPRLMKMDKPKTSRYLMKSIETAQDRILPSSQDRNSFWIHSDVPPRPLKTQANGESDDELDFKIEEITGDLLDAPDGATIVHAVNCLGVWGYGVAKQLKIEFPAAFNAYQSYCTSVKKPKHLAGECFLIPPQREDYEQGNRRKRWIACLFTSVGYGKKNVRLNNPGRDAPDEILTSTHAALEDFRLQLEEWARSNSGAEEEFGPPGEIWSCKFNSGAFGVDWKETKTILEEEFFGFGQTFTVVEKSDKVDSK